MAHTVQFIKQPAVTPGPFLFEWTHPETEGTRYQFPILQTTDLNLDPFRDYLKDMCLREDVIGQYIRSIRMFFTFLNVDGGSWELTELHHDVLLVLLRPLGLD